jgi:type I restriction enzyme S subunit
MTKRLKYLASINDDKLPDDTDPNTIIRYIDIGSVGLGKLTTDPESMAFGEAPSRARRLVRAGDIIVSTVRTYLRAVWPVVGDTTDLVVSTGFSVVRPRELDERYAAWLLQSDVFIEQVIARSVGVSYPAINPMEMGDLRVPVPSLSDQRAIADYLDRETARIDALVKKKTRLVQLLEERVECRIRERIAASALVSSVAEGSTVPIKRALMKLARPASRDSGMVTAFRDGQVTSRSLRRVDGFTEAWTDDATVQGVRTNDVVIHGLDGFAGAVGTAEVDGVCSPVYHVCAPLAGGDALYLGRMLRILAVSGYLGLFASSTRERAVDFRNWDLFGRIPIPRVDQSEQAEIGNAIRRIGRLKLAVERSAALALERRRTLITWAVTGRVDIHGIAA